MPLRSKLVAGLCLAAMACSAPGVVEARALTVEFRPGDSVTYRIRVTVNGTIGIGTRSRVVQSDQTITEAFKVLSVGPDGTADIQVTATLPPVQGAASATPTSQTFGMKVSRDGRIVSGGQSNASTTSPSVPGNDQVTPLLPDHKVKVGDTWSRDYSRPNPLGEGTFSLRAGSVYARDEKLGTLDTAVIQSKITGPFDFTLDLAKLTSSNGSDTAALPKTGSVRYSGSISSDGTYWLDLASKQVVKSRQVGHYTIQYDLSSVGGAADAGLSRIKFDGDITTETVRA